jgi:N-formylglutamate deformylase
LPSDLFTIHRPEPGTIVLPVIANLPHSGLRVPDAIAQQFTDEHLRSLPNSDWHLQPLYSFLPSLGITVMQANYSRYVVDLNRALIPPFFGSFWSAVVAAETAFKQPIYRTEKPSKEEVRARIDEFYTPYHQQLKALLRESIAQHGHSYLLDLHSFMGLIEDDVCLGNGNGQTCSSALIDTFAHSFAQQDYQVVCNKVFSGGYITRHYGQHSQIDALQIEIRYPTYLPDDQLIDSTSGLPRSHIPQWQSPKFYLAQEKLKQVFQSFIASLSRA